MPNSKQINYSTIIEHLITIIDKIDELHLLRKTILYYFESKNLSHHMVETTPIDEKILDDNAKHILRRIENGGLNLYLLQQDSEQQTILSTALAHRPTLFNLLLNMELPLGGEPCKPFLLLLNVKDKAGNTILHQVMEGNHSSLLIDILRNHGDFINPFIANADGKIIVEMMSEANSTVIDEMLKQHAFIGANVGMINHTQSSGMSILYGCAAKLNLDSITKFYPIQFFDTSVQNPNCNQLSALQQYINNLKQGRDTRALRPYIRQAHLGLTRIHQALQQYDGEQKNRAFFHANLSTVNNFLDFYRFIMADQASHSQTDERNDQLVSAISQLIQDKSDYPINTISCSHYRSIINTRLAQLYELQDSLIEPLNIAYGIPTNGKSILHVVKNMPFTTHGRWAIALLCITILLVILIPITYYLSDVIVDKSSVTFDDYYECLDIEKYCSQSMHDCIELRSWCDEHANIFDYCEFLEEDCSNYWDKSMMYFSLWLLNGIIFGSSCFFSFFTTFMHFVSLICHSLSSRSLISRNNLLDLRKITGQLVQENTTLLDTEEQLILKDSLINPELARALMEKIISYYEVQRNNIPASDYQFPSIQAFQYLSFWHQRGSEQANTLSNEQQAYHRLSEQEDVATSDNEEIEIVCEPADADNANDEINLTLSKQEAPSESSALLAP